MKKIDLYIFKRFLITFFFAISLIISIAVVFDISEKIDDFIEGQAPFSAIVLEYYLNFIPYFANLFSPLFTFIAVIFFTSKMAYNSEIIAILSSGVSFKRLLIPYFLSSFVIASISFFLNHYVIPVANKKRLMFEETYIKNPYHFGGRNIHRQVKPGEFIYFESYNDIMKMGYKFSYEIFNKDLSLKSKLISNVVKWDSTKNTWLLQNYFIRTFNGDKETLISGISKDTIFNFSPADFNRRITYIEMMNTPELKKFIKEEKFKGSDEIPFYEVELYKRSSFPFATFILTLIAVSVASRKVRGGTGLHIGIGLLISFSYIMFMQVAVSYATYGNVPTLIAIWMPNIIFAFLSLFLLRLAPK